MAMTATVAPIPILSSVLSPLPPPDPLFALPPLLPEPPPLLPEPPPLLPVPTDPAPVDLEAEGERDTEREREGESVDDAVTGDPDGVSEGVLEEEGVSDAVSEGEAVLVPVTLGGPALAVPDGVTLPLGVWLGVPAALPLPVADSVCERAGKGREERGRGGEGGE
jgi:hypothetical protein